MSVITISRGSFSGGKALAECLAGCLGFRCVDREVIVERAAAHGISQEELREALEKPPRLLQRFSHKKYVYLALIQAALTEEVRTGRAVYHGNAGHLLLRGGPHILRTRIIAPLDSRVRVAQERLRLTRAEALAYIQRMDHNRSKWTRYLYGVDWGDPSLYDLVVNLECMDIPDACQTIAAAVRQRCFEFTPECQAALEDLALASRARAILALDPATADLELDVSARRAVIFVSGRLAYPEQAEEIRRIVQRIPGVKSTDVDHLRNSI